MSKPSAFVHVDTSDGPEPVASLWVRHDRGRITASFQYAESWLAHPDRFAVDPLLNLSTAGFHKTRLFGAIADSAPDRWGRTLMARSERLRATEEGRPLRTLSELDFVLGVSDLTRQGALRFTTEEGGDFVASADEAAVPPLVALPALLAAAQGFLENPDSVEDLRLLLAPGSSLGGARPKASVRGDDGALSIAKFPKKDDAWSLEGWEQLTLDMARDAGIRVAESQLLSLEQPDALEQSDVLLLRRFDRQGTKRVPFLSAMSLLDAVDQETRSYLEIAEVIRRFSGSARVELRELWRRIVFNVLVSNTDDHLRNHGFLYTTQGNWELSPAYDLNPTPTEVKPRFLSTAIGEDPHDTSASLRLALSVANYFDLEDDEARAIAREVADVTCQWADRANAQAIPSSQIDLMRSAFEHEDLALALEG